MTLLLCHPFHLGAFHSSILAPDPRFPPPGDELSPLDAYRSPLASGPPPRQLATDPHPVVPWGLLDVIVVAVLFIGSVHLGWHYAVDGYVAIVGTAAIWWAVGRAQGWRRPSRQPAPTPTARPETT